MYWTYENWIHKYSRVHKANCPYCNDGNGFHDSLDSHAGRCMSSVTKLLGLPTTGPPFAGTARQSRSPEEFGRSARLTPTVDRDELFAVISYL